MLELTFCIGMSTSDVPYSTVYHPCYLGEFEQGESACIHLLETWLCPFEVCVHHQKGLRYLPVLLVVTSFLVESQA